MNSMIVKTDILSVRRLLNKKSSLPYITLKKEDIKCNIYTRQNYIFYVFIKYIPTMNIYEVFLSIDDSKDVIGGLLYKNFRTKIVATNYHKYISYIIKHKSIAFISKKLNTI